MELELILAIVSAISAIAVGFWVGLRTSKRVEKSAQKQMELEEEIGILSGELDGAEIIIEENQDEINLLKSIIEEKEQEIAELKERLRVAEEVAERDIDKVKEKITNLIMVIEEMLSQMENSQKTNAEQKERKAGKAKK